MMDDIENRYCHSHHGENELELLTLALLVLDIPKRKRDKGIRKGLKEENHSCSVYYQTFFTPQPERGVFQWYSD
jgi:hypothetical protein